MWCTAMTICMYIYQTLLDMEVNRLSVSEIFECFVFGHCPYMYSLCIHVWVIIGSMWCILITSSLPFFGVICGCYSMFS